MNIHDIRKNLTYSGMLCILCIFLAALCLWLHIMELTLALGFLAFFEGLMCFIWYKRQQRELKRIKEQEKKRQKKS